MNKEIDYSYVIEAIGGDKSILKEVLTIFVEETPKIATDINSALTEKNWSKLKNGVHKMKSSLRMFGLKDIANRCGDIEQMIIDKKDLDPVSKIINQLNQELSFILDDVRKYINNL